MENFHVYRDGEYDHHENLKIKIDDALQSIKQRAASKLEEIDYYFVNHKKMIR